MEQLALERLAEAVGVIDASASRTNRLALDAGVQAARAGGHGPDFAVFAAEVRELTRRSADAVGEIRRLIDDSAKLLSACQASVDRAGMAKPVKPAAIVADPAAAQNLSILQNN